MTTHGTDPEGVGGTVSELTVSQTWTIDSGVIILEIRSDKPLPAGTFTRLARVVGEIEALAAVLGTDGLPCLHCGVSQAECDEMEQFQHGLCCNDCAHTVEEARR